MPRQCLESALQAANGHAIYGYILERLWLHMFGAPFMLPAAQAVRHLEDFAAPPAQFAPAVQPLPRLSLARRVVVRLKRRAVAWKQS